MKKFFVLFSVAAVAAFAIWGFSDRVEADVEKAATASPHLVISQFQAGGTSNANDEFIEIHNTSSAPVDLNGYRVVYRSANGSNDVGPMAVWNTTTILQPGQFYLIAATSYTGSVTPDLTYNPTSCSCSMSANAGGLAIRQGDNNTGAVIDAVGWGGATNIFFEGTRTTAPANSTSQARKNSGCLDTDNNSSDFENLNPSAPRSTGSTSTCGSTGTELFATINANPTTVAPGGSTLIYVTTVPATTPPSTNITVVANLAQINGAGSQTLYDDGTNGDVTAGDNVFSYNAAIPAEVTGGSKLIPAVAADAQGRTVNLQLTLTVNAPNPNEDPLLLGNPSGATADTSNENNYLMPKPQYTLSYNRSKATPNWVAWRLDSSWLGSTPRQDDYRPDPALPAAWYHVQDNDYSGSGYDRGHMCPSGDRTNSVANNSATFLMTNFVPQLGANNQGPWNDFENYCRSLANQGNEIYIFDGPVGNIGTIAQGRIVVPQYTWKVVLILPNGSNDLQRVTRSTRAFGIVVPNFPPLNSNTPWRQFRVSVDAVENLTGYNFFSNIPINTQAIIERRHDVQ
ncbi:MAG: DNA/RNA non-specific endonuclease [Pyrinomonadaceae bacterium]|nr:DNA/RNA non-specific endonuclease [Pyrinomonadaceae bacterium]